MKTQAFAALGAALACLALQARGDAVAPPPSLVLDGVPPIPAELAEKLAPYGDFRAHAMLSWHPLRREMLILRRLAATNQIHLVTEPGVTPAPLTDFPDAVSGARFEPTRGDYFLFLRAEGGNEVFRIFREDVATKEAAALSPEGERAAMFAFSRKGDRIVYTTQPVDRNNPDARRARWST
jgi:hypothetical protein